MDIQTDEPADGQNESWKQVRCLESIPELVDGSKLCAGQLYEVPATAATTVATTIILHHTLREAANNNFLH